MRAGYPAAMTTDIRAADLDVVVLGGGGHVGLPLSLAFAKAGCGSASTTSASRRSIGSPPARCRSWRTARTSSCARSCRRAGCRSSTTARSSSGPSRSSSSSARRSTSSSGPSMTVFERAVDQIAPHLRDGRPGRPAEHRLSGHDGLRRAAPRGPRLRVDVAFCPERIAEGHALEELAHAAPDHRRRHGPAADRAARAVQAPGGQDDPNDDQGSRAREAVHEHVALHEVRGREPVLHDRGPGRRRLHATCSTRSATDYPRAARPARPGLRGRPVPVQGHDAARRVHERPLPARPGRDAGQRGPAGLRRVGPRAPVRRPQGQDRRDPRHGVQGRVGRPAGLAELQAAQAPRRGPAPGSCARIRTSATIA